MAFVNDVKWCIMGFLLYLLISHLKEINTHRLDRKYFFSKEYDKKQLQSDAFVQNQHALD